MILVSKTYWGVMPFWFRRPPERARVESVVIRTHDMRVIRGLWWAREDRPQPKVGVLVIHPRVDFAHHYAVPRLVAAGFGVLAANTRHVGNDTQGEHEEMVLDVAACVRHLRERRGIERVVLLGNSGGGSLCAFYQAEARMPPQERLERSPGGAPTHFGSAPLTPADAMVYLAAHRGQGKVLLDAIDPSVVDERDPQRTDPSLDMYDPSNGFCEPPGWSAYDEAFLKRYLAAQTERVRRIDALAREHVARHAEATRESEAEGFAERPFAERQAVLKRRAFEPVLVVYRTMANPNHVARHLDPSDREYGSLLSERPDLMNHAALGFARTVTPRAWLSTWSGLSSNADLVTNVARIAEPSLFVYASRDREIFPRADVAPTVEACAARDKKVVTLEGARHYFEPDPGEVSTPEVERAMDVVIRWIEERFG
jgi:alpha-beta hydrolase superfamily lysophospholipase